MWDVVIALVVVAICACLLFWYKRKSGIRADRDFSSLHGTARLLALIEHIHDLNTHADQSMYARFWSVNESQLREVLADNTAETKQQLVDALNAAHAYCRDRDLAKSIIAMRNQALDGTV